MKRIRNYLAAATLAATCTVFQSCPVDSKLLSDCFSEDSISRSEYEDMNDFEQSLYDRNDCGRYEPANDFADLFLRSH